MQWAKPNGAAAGLRCCPGGRRGGRGTPLSPAGEERTDDGSPSYAWDFLASIQAKNLVDAEERKEALPWLGGKRLRGDDYLVHVALPSFFYATMVYAILRHNGVDIGKMDFLGAR